MELKPGYKQTEAGVLPREWESKRLGDLFTLRNGFAFSSAFFSNSGPVVLTPGNFRLDGGLYFDDGNTKRYAGPYDPSMVFDDGDLLIVMTDLTPQCNLLGKPAFVHTREFILHNQRIGKVLLRSPLIEKRYLYYVLLSRPYLVRLRELATGSTVRHTSNTSIYSVLIPLPTSKEQEAISDVLEDMDALISGLDELVTKTRDLKQAAMQQLLSGKRRLPGFSGEWEVKTVGELAHGDENVVDGPFGSNLKNSDYVSSGVPVLQGLNITGDKFVWRDVRYISEHKAKELLRSDALPGDLLTVKIGSVGFSALIEHLNGHKFAIIPANLLRLRFNVGAADSRFVYYVLTSNGGKRALRDLSGNTAQPAIGLAGFRKLRFNVPKETKEQTAIAAVLSDMDAEIAALEQRRDKTRAIKQGMMQELLTGKTRLI